MSFVVGFTSGRGGPGKSFLSAASSIAAVRRGLTVAKIEASVTNLSGEHLDAVSGSGSGGHAFTIEDDVDPDTWWTHPMARYQSVFGIADFVDRQPDSVSDLVIRAVTKARDRRHVVVVDLPPATSELWFKRLIDSCDVVVWVVNHTHDAWSSGAAIMNSMTASASTGGWAIPKSKFRWVYTSGNDDVNEYREAQHALASYGFLGKIPYSKRITVGGNKGDQAASIPPKSFTTIDEVVGRLMGWTQDHPIPMPRVRVPRLRHRLRRSASVVADGELSQTAVSAESDGLRQTNTASILTTPALQSAESMETSGRWSFPPPGPSSQTAASVVEGRPTQLLRVFGRKPGVDGVSPDGNDGLRTLIAFVLDAADGPRSPEAVSSVLFKSKSRINNVVTQTTPIVSRIDRALVLDPTTTSDWRWLLRMVTAAAAQTGSIRTTAVGECVSLLGRFEGPAFGDCGGDFQWAADYAAEDAVAGLINACQQLVAAWERSPAVVSGSWLSSELLGVVDRCRIPLPIEMYRAAFRAGKGSREAEASVQHRLRMLLDDSDTARYVSDDVLREVGLTTH